MRFLTIFIILSISIISVDAAKFDYVKLVSNTDHCINNCETVYEICPLGDDGSKFDLDFKDKNGTKVKGLENKKIKNQIDGTSFKVKDLKIEYKKPKQIASYEPCQKTFTRINNETNQEETIQYNEFCPTGTQYIEGTTWEPYSKDTPQPTQCYQLRIKAKINWNNWVDNVISYAGYSYDEYAAWSGDVWQDTLTTDFIGNQSNITIGADKLAMDSQLAGGLVRHVWETFENNSKVQYTEGGADGACILRSTGALNGSYSLNLESTGGDVPCYRRAQDYSQNGEPFNVTFTLNFTNIANGNWATFFVGKSNAPSGALSSPRIFCNACGNNAAVTIAGKAGNFDTGLDWNLNQNHHIIYEYTRIGNNETNIRVYVDGSASANVSVDFDITNLDYFGMHQNQNNNIAVIDDVKIYNHSTVTTLFAQGYYYSQKIDTGVENETVRINVSTNNATALRYECRIASTDAALSSADWFAFTHNTDLTTKGRFVQYRLNLTHDLAEVYEINLSRRLDTLGDSSDETTARAAIQAAINAHLLGQATYTDQQVYLRSAANTQVKAAIDKIVVWNNKRWLFNYIAGADPATGIFNITPTVYSLEMQNLTASQIQQQIGKLINDTK